MRDSSSVLPLTGVVLFALAGCSSAGDGTADCGQQLRLDGVTYTGWSITEKDAQRFGEAERARCDDNGTDARGSYFPDQPERVTVWSFDGHPPEQVLGVRFDKESYTVFVADSLADVDRDRIVRELRRRSEPQDSRRSSLSS